MSLGLMGKKCGMTRIFTESGKSIPVTVIEIAPNRVTQIKTTETDGYCAIQLTAGHQKATRVNKALAGHFAKSDVAAGGLIKEFRVLESEMADIKMGDSLTLALFEAGQTVDVRGLTRGKGFAGTIKRHNFKSQDTTHGNSLSHRAPGSIGQCQWPGRVFKGKKMAGHMGNANCTLQNQEIIKIDVERNLILIKGAIPGAPGSKVIITKSVKGRRKS